MHLYFKGYAAKTRATIEKPNIPFCSQNALKNLSVHLNSVRLILFELPHFFLSRVIHEIFCKFFTKIQFSQKRLVTSTNLKNQHPIFFRFFIRIRQFAQIEKMAQTKMQELLLYEASTPCNMGVINFFVHVG